MPCPQGQMGPGSCSQQGCYPSPSLGVPNEDCGSRSAGDLESCCKATGAGNEWDTAAKAQCESEGGTWEDTGDTACGTISSHCVDPQGTEWCWGGTSWQDWILIFPVANTQVKKPADCWEQNCWYAKCRIFRCKACTCPNCPPGKCPSTTSIGESFLT